jgi:hypothetical protein
MRTIFFAVSSWTTLCSLLALSSVEKGAPLGLLVAGWVVAIVGLPIFFFINYKFGDSLLAIFGKRSASPVAGASSSGADSTNSTPA